MKEMVYTSGTVSAKLWGSQQKDKKKKEMTEESFEYQEPSGKGMTGDLSTEGKLLHWFCQ